jgi:16S rRNA (guanine966-N2)-methyltransferase
MRKHKKSAPQGIVRIIGGQWRSRKLHFTEQPGLRPTPDRIRETVFNWLAPYLPGSRCLDLFCGSAALGFESLSRGASETFFVDNNPSVKRDWEANRQTLAAENARFFLTDAHQWLSTNSIAPCDILFVDPPYANQGLNATFTALCTSSILAPAGLIYFEHPRNEAVETPASWALFREKLAGNNRYCIYQNKENAL